MTSPRSANNFQVLLDSQYGLATQTQLAPYGYARPRLRHLVETGQWVAVLRGIYAVTNGPLTRQMALMAALLYAGPRAILSHRTAAEEWRILPVDPTKPIHVTVPYGESAKCQSPTYVSPPAAGARPLPLVGDLRHPGVVVHRSRAQAHIAVDGIFPRTKKTDTAIDLAVGEPSARAAHSSLIATVTNANIRLDDIRGCLEQRAPRRYRKALDAAVALLASGVQSVLEHRYVVDVEEAHGLPVSRKQSPVVVDGRTLYEDCDYSDVGVPLLVRLDGKRVHAVPQVAFRDRRRDNAAELAGRPRLTFGYEEVTEKPCAVAAEVEHVLARNGWVRKTPGSCPACESFRRA